MSNEFAVQITELALQLAAQPDLASTLDASCREAADAVGADAAGIFLLEGGRLVTAASTEPGMAAAEQAQSETGEGPCLDAVREQRTVVISEMAGEQRWPGWAPRMVRLGWHSVLSVQLIDPAREPFGSLNLFGRRPSQFDAHDAEVAEVYAQHASLAIRNARHDEELHDALTSRHLVGVAQGILMHRYDLSLSAAFDALRQQAQTSQQQLVAVAAGVVECGDLRGISPAQS